MQTLQVGLAARAVESALLAKNGVKLTDIINDWRGFSGLLGSHCENRFLKLEKCLEILGHLKSMVLF